MDLKFILIEIILCKIVKFTFCELKKYERGKDFYLFG